MNTSSVYPMSFCETCITSLETAVGIRDNFKKSEEFWVQFLSQRNDVVVVKEEPEYQIHDDSISIQSDSDSNAISQIINAEPAFQIQMSSADNSIVKTENIFHDERKKRKRNEGK